MCNKFKLHFFKSIVKVLLKDTFYTLEPLKTDTSRNKQRCPSYRGVHLIEAFQIFHIIVYVTLQIPL